MSTSLSQRTPDIQGEGEVKMMASIVEYDNLGMSGTDRCDRCGTQAYGEVLLKSGGQMMFCAHHLTENWEKLLEAADTIADHRKWLSRQEGISRSAATVTL